MFTDVSHIECYGLLLVSRTLGSCAWARSHSCACMGYTHSVSPIWVDYGLPIRAIQGTGLVLGTGNFADVILTLGCAPTHGNFCAWQLLGCLLNLWENISYDILDLGHLGLTLMLRGGLLLSWTCQLARRLRMGSCARAWANCCYARST